ncbi:heme NO-binding domain-containing protein [Actibacterium sp. 188UL27-1]|uniref:heme NO-binding domain-containing protein n=1 Tax=Actibacterium sp. 188UL27-1 TaxID=2786961 RepID=UPI00195DBB47|nr:heme NO-binding domain-containing protein [Actibacterium sp. 188UL27-1]MBM7069328.1 heme NO-binding domain-containing protein [Actibacterium sp. 188UL27-1]
MHGLINRSIQCFIRDNYGQSTWDTVARDAHLPALGFEAMLEYDDQVTHRMLDMVALHLDKSRPAVLEDVGTYLITHSNTRAIRRLLRFAGETFEEFLNSLDDLPDRVRLAVPDLQFPRLDTVEPGPNQVEVTLSEADPEFGFVLMGILRALADDYGALVFIDHKVDPEAGVILAINLLDAAFAEGNAFSLARTQIKEKAV